MSDYVELMVEDTGIGIEEENIGKLFERFHRIENSKGRSYEGTGIGLALVAELVKLHQGTIRAESKIGEGTRFIVNLPLGSSHLIPEQIGKRDSYQLGKLGMAFVEESMRWHLVEKTVLQTYLNL
mgnify:CR=1 FL=1